MSEKKQSKESQKLHIEVVKQMVTLSTSGFGLVAALAWNNFIQELVSNYIKKWLPQNSGIISLLIYAIVITFLAVVVTLQLSRLAQKLQKQSED
ncbi:MAG: hypothetical protein A3B44_01945 [Candidatus Levybacteria bacterium RIFCSPLOWO2_01_FULL_38_21]|nr:MAG: hypothetical protein A3B44_01945 [Candidatus Levybacteria bacterium RIFCSPLOWO2_01_FULL_38_21]